MNDQILYERSCPALAEADDAIFCVIDWKAKCGLIFFIA